MQKKSERLDILMTPQDRATLKIIAEHDRTSEAAVVRRLIAREAERLGIKPQTFSDVAKTLFSELYPKTSQGK